MSNATNAEICKTRIKPENLLIIVTFSETYNEQNIYLNIRRKSRVYLTRLLFFWNVKMRLLLYKLMIKTIEEIYKLVSVNWFYKLSQCKQSSFLMSLDSVCQRFRAWCPFKYHLYLSKLFAFKCRFVLTEPLLNRTKSMKSVHKHVLILNYFILAWKNVSVQIKYTVRYS